MKRRFAALVVLALLACQPPQPTTPPASGAAQAVQPPLPKALADALTLLHGDLERARETTGTPGAALLIVQGDRVIHAAGYGSRGNGTAKPVDADSVFAIGSTTKAFTAMLVMMAVEADKLDLSDSPTTCLPGFTLADPEAAAAVTIRDLLTHRSGLGRTDMAWYAGKLSRAQLLQVAAVAEPVAPLGTEYNYQNLMFVAAGECAARAFGGRYEALIRSKIFEPLGMGAATIDVAGGRAAKNRAHGHARVGDDERAVPVALKDIDAVAPAGAINASVNTMAPWLRLMLGGGEVDGTRLLQPDNFARLVAPHTTIRPGVSYGLGWVLDQWRGTPRVWHNGGIDGYYALISMLPEHDIGFVLLTSDDSAKLQDFVTDRVFELAVPKPHPTSAAKDDASAFAGTYGIIGGFQAVVATDSTGATTLTVPAQPPYPLLPADGAKFKLGAPAPEGFFARFEGTADARVLTIEQPQGPLALPSLSADLLAKAKIAKVPKALLPLLGTYHSEESGITVSLIQSEGRVALSAAGQTPAPLVEQGEDKFGLDGLPNAFSVTVMRDKKGRIAALGLAQPQGSVELTRVPDADGTAIKPEALLREVARAHGSKAMAGHQTMVVRSRVALLNQGLSGFAVSVHERPHRYSETLELTGAGQPIATIWVGHDGARAWERSTFSPLEDVSAAQAESLRLQAMFDPWAEPSAAFDSVEVLGVDMLPGASEPAVVLKRTTASGIEWTDAIGKQTRLLLQRTTTVPGRGERPPTTATRRFGDYREVGGVMIAHLVESTTENGTVVATVESVTFDGAVPPGAFDPPAPGGS